MGHKGSTLLKEFNPNCDENSSFKFYSLAIECIYQWSYLHPTSKSDPNEPSMFIKAADYLTANKVGRIDKIGAFLYQNPSNQQVFIKPREPEPAQTRPAQEPSNEQSQDLGDPAFESTIREGIRKMRVNAVEFIEAIESNKNISVEETNELFTRTIKLFNTYKADFNKVTDSNEPSLVAEKKMILNEKFLINKSHVLFSKYQSGELTVSQFVNGVGGLYQTYRSNLADEKLEPEAPVQNPIHAAETPESQPDPFKKFFGEAPANNTAANPIQESAGFFNFGQPQPQEQEVNQEAAKDPFAEFGFGSTEPKTDNQKKNLDASDARSARSSAKRDSLAQHREVQEISEKPVAITEVVRIERGLTFAAKFDEPATTLPDNLRSSVEKMVAARMHAFGNNAEIEGSMQANRPSIQNSQQSRVSMSQMSTRQQNNVKITAKKTPQVVFSKSPYDDHLPQGSRSIWFDPVPDLSKVLEDHNNSLISKRLSHQNKLSNKTEEFFSVKSGDDGRLSLPHYDTSMISPRIENSMTITPDKVLQGFHSGSTNQPTKRFNFEDLTPEPKPASVMDTKPPVVEFQPENPINQNLEATIHAPVNLSTQPQQLSTIAEENLLGVPSSEHQVQRSNSGDRDVSFAGVASKDREETITRPAQLTMFEESTVVQNLKAQITFLETELANKNYDAWTLNTKYEKEIEALTKTVNDLRMENLEIKKQAASNESFDQDLHQQLSNLLEENSRMVLQLSKLSNDHVILTQQYDALRRDSSEKINQQNELIQIAESSYRQVVQEARELSEANSRMVAQLAGAKPSDDFIQELDAQIVALKNELNKTKAELNQSQMVKISYEHLNKDQNAYYKACQDQVADIKAQFEASLQQLTESHEKERQRTTEAHQASVRKFIQQIKDLEKQLMAQSNLNVQKNTLAYLAPSLATSSLDSGLRRSLGGDAVQQHSQMQIEQLEAEVRLLREKQIKNEVDIDYYRETLERRDKEIDEMATHCEKLAKELKEAKGDNLQQLQVILTKERAYEDVHNKFSELIKRYTGLHKSLESKEHEEAVLRKELNEYHSRMIKISEKHAAELEAIVRNPVKDIEMQRLTEMNDINEKKIVELISFNLKLKQKIIELETDLELQSQAKGQEKNILRQLETELNAAKEELFLKKKRILDLEEKVIDSDIAEGQVREFKQEILLYKFILEEVIAKNGSLELGELSEEIERLIKAPFPTYNRNSQIHQIVARLDHFDSISRPVVEMSMTRLQDDKEFNSSIVAKTPKGENQPSDVEPNVFSLPVKYESVWSTLKTKPADASPSPVVEKPVLELFDSKVQTNETRFNDTAAYNLSAALEPVIGTNPPEALAAINLPVEVKDFKEILKNLSLTDDQKQITKEVCLNRSGLFFDNEFLNFFLESASYDHKSDKTTLHIRFVSAGPTTITKVGFDNYGKCA